KLHDMDRAWEVARDLAVALEREGNGYFMVSDWSMENANMFRALKLEKTMIGILLSLIILMGAFSLLNSQVMLVTDKLADIAMLRTLGLTPRGVMGVFMVQGTLIGVLGTVLGVVGGLLLTFNLEHILRAIEAAFEVVLMPDAVYYVTGLPIDLQGTLIGVIGAVLGVVGALLLTFNLEHILRAIEAAFEVVLMPDDVYYVTGLPIDLQVNDVVVIAVVALLMAFLATIYPAWRAARTAPAEALRYE